MRDIFVSAYTSLPSPVVADLRCTSNERFSAFHPFLIYVLATASASFRKMFGNCRCNATMFELHEVEGIILSKI